MTAVSLPRPRRPARATAALLGLAVVAGAAGAGCDRREAPQARCLGARATVAAEGEGFGGWTLLVAPEWGDGGEPALDFRGEFAERGCGTTGPAGDPITYSGGGAEVDGTSIRYVYGVVRRPVERVRISYERGPSVEVAPFPVDGLDDHRVFVHVQAAPAGFTVTGLDRDGDEVPAAADRGSVSTGGPRPDG